MLDSIWTKLKYTNTHPIKKKKSYTYVYINMIYDIFKLNKRIWSIIIVCIVSFWIIIIKNKEENSWNFLHILELALLRNNLVQSMKESMGPKREKRDSDWCFGKKSPTHIGVVVPNA